jgi:hypothetical protein
MAKTKKRIDRSKVVTFILSAVLVLAAAVVVFKMQSSALAVHISLGPLTYKVENGRAVKRTDPTVTELQSFLEAQGRNSGCQTTVYHNVIAASPDEKQVLLNYGCNSPEARMFAVNTNGQWRTVSPTNQFDSLGIPLCEHVEQNNISVSIAPVCFNQANGGQSKYFVRASQNF